MSSSEDHASPKIFFSLLFLFVAGMAGWIIYLKYSDEQLTKAGGVAYTAGTIVACSGHDRIYQASIQYKYSVNDSVYVGFHMVACSWCNCDGQQTCLGKKFSVVYAKADPTHSIINLTQPLQ